jgi:hypothetical protein
MRAGGNYITLVLRNVCSSLNISRGMRSAGNVERVGSMRYVLKIRWEESLS